MVHYVQGYFIAHTYRHIPFECLLQCTHCHSCHATPPNGTVMSTAMQYIALKSLVLVHICICVSVYVRMCAYGCICRCILLPAFTIRPFSISIYHARNFTWHYSTICIAVSAPAAKVAAAAAAAAIRISAAKLLAAAGETVTTTATTIKATWRWRRGAAAAAERQSNWQPNTFSQLHLYYVTLSLLHRLTLIHSLTHSLMTTTSKYKPQHCKICLLTSTRLACCSFCCFSASPCILLNFSLVPFPHAHARIHSRSCSPTLIWFSYCSNFNYQHLNERRVAADAAASALPHNRNANNNNNKLFQKIYLNVKRNWNNTNGSSEWLLVYLPGFPLWPLTTARLWHLLRLSVAALRPQFQTAATTTTSATTNTFVKCWINFLI